MKLRAISILLAACLAAPQALANDTTAKLSAGGLVLTKSDNIAMLSEDLFVSPSEVRVRYRFQNRTRRPVTTRIAFPMPDIGGPGFFEGDVAIPVEESDNFLGFSTRVDGQEVATDVEQKALVDGVDRTKWLVGHGIPLAPHRQETLESIRRLSPPIQAEAYSYGLVDDELRPAWTLKSTYHWVQTFAPGRPVSIEHRYTPSVGSTAGTEVATAEGVAKRKRYCVGEDILSTVRGSAKANDGLPRYSERWLDYVLVTGANWKEPIGTFRLVVDKGAPETLMSFCAEGVRKIGPTQFEMRRTNWRPDRDLSILLLTPY